MYKLGQNNGQGPSWTWQCKRLVKHPNLIDRQLIPKILGRVRLFVDTPTGPHPPGTPTQSFPPPKWVLSTSPQSQLGPSHLLRGVEISLSSCSWLLTGPVRSSFLPLRLTLVYPIYFTPPVKLYFVKLYTYLSEWKIPNTSPPKFWINRVSKPMYHHQLHSLWFPRPPSKFVSWSDP